jgi:hypothetical protein
MLLITKSDAYSKADYRKVSFDAKSQMLLTVCAIPRDWITSIRIEVPALLHILPGEAVNSL